MHEYQQIAELYAVDFADVHDDVDFYRSFAQHTRGPIVEFMCGTGRVCVPLAVDGNHVVGVDSSDDMLTIAQRTRDANQIDSLTLHRGDVRSWQGDTKFGLAIVALNSFMHLTSVDDQVQALSNIHRNLQPGGYLVLDLFHPDMRALPDYKGDVVLDKRFALSDGRIVHKFVSQWSDIAQQLIHVVFMYDISDTVSGIQRKSASFAMRYFWRYEIEHLLARTGFTLQHCYGSYELDAFGSESEQMLIVAKRNTKSR
ncbi:MAG: class I SAM-dependent methyltransferase [Chloroflexota bacterium]|jgi:SAM-dependent methyltransferase